MAEQGDSIRRILAVLVWDQAVRLWTTLAEADTDALPLTDSRVADSRATCELLAQAFLKAAPRSEPPPYQSHRRRHPAPARPGHLPVSDATAGVAVGDQVAQAANRAAVAAGDIAPDPFTPQPLDAAALTGTPAERLALVEAALRAADDHAADSVKAARIRWTIEKGAALKILVDQVLYTARGHTSLATYADEVLHTSRDNVYKTIEAADALRTVLAATRVSKILDTPPNASQAKVLAPVLCITTISDVCQNGSIKTRNPDTGQPYDTDTPALKNWLTAWANKVIRPRLVNTLRALHEKAPNAKIVLMGYPRLPEKNGSCVLGIGTGEAPWLNEMGDVVATEMKGAVSDAGSYAVFADPRSAFAGQAICGDPETMHHPQWALQGRHQADLDEVVPPQGLRNGALRTKALQDALAR
ncbi:SGNH/GDSL hydrolase family protein [Streptomyces fradiae]|uniref:hypothetical protein n=1 Tax=Streptomyces fradiae TaxID=1906 RepID=UPI003675575B